MLQPKVFRKYLRPKEDDTDQRKQGFQELVDKVVEKEVLGLAEEDSLDADDVPANTDLVMDVDENEASSSSQSVAAIEANRDLSRHRKAAKLLADFVGEEISYMVIEARGQQHFVTPRRKWLPKKVFRQLQHVEQGLDQGNRAYGIIYDFWTEEMEERFPEVFIPLNASKAMSSPAGNIIETYKMIAEQLVEYRIDAERPAQQQICIDAAIIHLEATHMKEKIPDWHRSIYIACDDTCYGYCGCTASPPFSLRVDIWAIVFFWGSYINFPGL